MIMGTYFTLVGLAAGLTVCGVICESASFLASYRPDILAPSLELRWARIGAFQFMVAAFTLAVALVVRGLP
jgi:hypothetical protein